MRKGKKNLAGQPAGFRVKALRDESDLAISERIAALLALPMRKRMNFLRKRLPNGGSVL